MRRDDLTWSSLRSLNGSQQEGFEELCAQLARAEVPEGATFYRKGSPDAGVECYCILADGSEWGWQAKFFTASLVDAQWRQIDDSVRTALEKHPKLVRYYVCMPRDRPDARLDGKRSSLQKWHDHVEKWNGWATDRAMRVEFVWWGASELDHRLSQDRNAGRVAFWFGDLRRFNREWFESRLAEAVDTAGERYTPQAHVDLAVAGHLDLFGRADASIKTIRELRNHVHREFQALRLSPQDDGGIGQEFGLGMSLTVLVTGFLLVSTPWRLLPINHWALPQ